MERLNLIDYEFRSYDQLCGGWRCFQTKADLHSFRDKFQDFYFHGLNEDEEATDADDDNKPMFRVKIMRLIAHTGKLYN